MKHEWLITVKLAANPAHNPQRKVSGICPFSGKHCSDITGAHHTALTTAATAGEVAAAFKGFHITRIEEVS